MIKVTIGFGILSALILCASAGQVHALTLSEVLATKPEFSKLNAAVKHAGLEGAVSSLKDATVFAPTDRSFDNLTVGQTEALMKNPAKLKTLILNHIVPAAMTEDAFINAGFQTTLAGFTIKGISENSGGGGKRLFGRVATDCNRNGKLERPELIGSVQITQEDVRLDNNVIVHILDQVQGRIADKLKIPKDRGFPIGQLQFVGFSCGLLN